MSETPNLNPNSDISPNPNTIEKRYWAKLNEIRLKYELNDSVENLVKIDYNKLEESLSWLMNKRKLLQLFIVNEILAVFKDKSNLYIMEYTVKPVIPCIYLWEIPLEPVENN